MNIASCDIRHIIRNTVHPGPPAEGMYKSACVFLLLFEKKEPHILAIQKTDTEGYLWRNQVALPGGHVDEDETTADAVFRELGEELGISGNQVELVGSIGHFQTISNRNIEVFVGFWNGEGPVRHDTREISRVLEIPLRKLFDTHSAKKFHGRKLGLQELVYPFQDVVIWGVTAKILHYFIELLNKT